MSGGFIVESSTNGSSVLHGDGLSSTAGNETAPLLSLTPRQEGKLRAHLDEKILSLERDDRKGTLGPLPSLIDRITPLLHLILQIPPISPWSSLRIAYLLAFTGSITSYITSLPLYSSTSSTGSRGRNHAADEASRTMRLVLDFLKEVESGWVAVLRGDGWVMDPSRGRGRGVAVRFGGGLDATERTRLRSIVLTGRERMTAWARTYGSFPSSAALDGAANGAEEAVGPEWEWEHEILGMWNRILEMLSSDLEGTTSTVPSNGAE